MSAQATAVPTLPNGEPAGGPPAAPKDACLWCQKPFRPHPGGSLQRFCASKCKNAFWSATRRWAEQAIASGVLTVADIKNGAAAACTLLPAGISPLQVSPAAKPSPAASATDEEAEAAAQLFDDFLVFALCESDLWDVVAPALPDELFERIDRRIQVLCEEPGESAL